ncbi:hypothetical protein [Peribacillus loiseleuriae]|uniref:hypothetical protein n=1 Tax=Peribacillus loiseleuriae TaxID=1679170 RepID=UPI003D01ACCE
MIEETVAVDIVQAYQQAFEKKKQRSNLDNFLAECVDGNKDQIIKAIKNMKCYDQMFIIETVTFNILSGIFAEKSQSQLLDLIASGSVFKIKDSLIEKILLDDDIQSVLTLQEVVVV